MSTMPTERLAVVALTAQTAGIGAGFLFGAQFRQDRLGDSLDTQASDGHGDRNRSGTCAFYPPVWIGAVAEMGAALWSRLRDTLRQQPDIPI